MVAFVQFEGDRSVGMFPIAYSVELPDLDNIFEDSKKVREEIRQDLYKFYTGLEDYGVCRVVFEDECGDCGTIDCKGECQSVEI